MDKNMITLEKFAHSPKSVEGAIQLVDNIKSGKISKNVLPNTSPNFTGDMEYEDYISFRDFLESVNGRILLEQVEG